jgi:hypothetical protein
MDTNMLLYVAFIIYIMIMIFGFVFKVKQLFMIAGLLWFIPMFEISNTWITIVAVAMLLMHGLLGFYEPREEDF